MQQKILLVDDREDNLFSTETILEPGGYSFVKARSGRDALKILLSQIDFVLILMDVHMPGLSGFDTAALIFEREKLRQIPIIFITAQDDDENNIFRGYKTGAVDYISKPVKPELLRAKVAVFSELYRKNQQLISQEQRLKIINRSLENEINERKLSEMRAIELNSLLQVSINKLEVANKELDRISFMTAHDMQEPLRKIRTFIDMLVIKHGHLFNDEARTFTDRIQSSASRMQTLIKDLLTLSTVTDENQEYSEVNLNELVNEVITESENLIREKKASIKITDLPTIQAKRGLIYPLFNNLVGNALKYSKPGEPPVINISAETINSSANNHDGKTNIPFCKILIEDNGIGFEQKYAEQVFEMFKRLHGQREFEGTGIGLALCKKIVEKHNGFINVKSKVGKGSIFIVSLPVSQSAITKNRIKSYL